MAAPAAMGCKLSPQGRKKPIANGRPMKLYMHAHARFNLMRKKIARLRTKDAGMARRSVLVMSTMDAASIATSVPVESAMPISADASAGESLMPSPTMPMTWPRDWRSSTMAFLSAGVDEACTSSGAMPTAAATISAEADVSPVTIEDVMPNRERARMAARAEGLMVSERLSVPV
jgi:hypothetical protein